MPVGILISYGGLLGLVIYGCFLVIRQTGRTGELTEAISRYESRIAVLEERLAGLRKAREETGPGVDQLLRQVIELRGRRDELQIHYEDMLARYRNRDIDIGSGRGR